MTPEVCPSIQSATPHLLPSTIGCISRYQSLRHVKFLTMPTCWSICRAFSQKRSIFCFHISSPPWYVLRVRLALLLYLYLLTPATMANPNSESTLQLQMQYNSIILHRAVDVRPHFYHSLNGSRWQQPATCCHFPQNQTWIRMIDTGILRMTMSIFRRGNPTMATQELIFFSCSAEHFPCRLSPLYQVLYTSLHTCPMVHRIFSPPSFFALSIFPKLSSLSTCQPAAKYHHHHDDGHGETDCAISRRRIVAPNTWFWPAWCLLSAAKRIFEKDWVAVKIQPFDCQQ